MVIPKEREGFVKAGNMDEVLQRSKRPKSLTDHDITNWNTTRP